jgi:hypothetical protein
VTRGLGLNSGYESSIVSVERAPKTGWAVAPEPFVSPHLRSVPLVLFFLLHGQADETNLPS